MSTPLRILIVEDDPTTVMMMTEKLEQVGHTVCGNASDYASAVNLMKRELPDLAIVDIELKGQIDGIMTAQELVRIKPIPLLYLTALKDQETFLRGMHTNPVAFLHKPFQYGQLAMQVDLAWQNYGQRAGAGESPAEGGGRVSDYLFLPDSQDEGIGNSKKHVKIRFRVRIDDMIWLEAHGPRAAIYVTQDELNRLQKMGNPLFITLNLGSLLDYLPDHFYRLSPSIAINLNHLDRIKPGQVLMEGQTKALDLPEGERRKLLDRFKVPRSRQRR